MILAIDVGNSNIVLGGYTGNKICFITRIATNLHLEADQYAVELKGILDLYNVADSAIEGSVISSVVPGVTPMLVRALTHFTAKEPLVLSLANAGGMEIAIENPSELGTDILASAIAVRQSFALPAVIIDMGTATKLTALDKTGALRGVAIAPGLFVSLEALVGRASLLRSIPLVAPQSPIGRNTNESMQSGLVLGAASMLDGLIDRFEKQLGGKIETLIATGGAAPLIIPHCLHSIQFSETLLLDGLYIAYRQATP